MRTVEFPGIGQPMLVVSFPGGGHLSIEFTGDAPDDEQPRLGAWLELRADDPAAVLQATLDAGLTGKRPSTGEPSRLPTTWDLLIRAVRGICSGHSKFMTGRLESK